MEIRDIQQRTWANKLAKGFNTTDVALEFGLLTAEVSEAFTAWRRKLPDFGEELADVFLYLAALAEMNGVESPPSPKKRLTRFRAMPRWLSPTSLMSAFAAVVSVPPPTPNRNNRNVTLRNPGARGRANNAIAIKTRPTMTPSFLPSASTIGPTASEARINPSACANAIVPFWLGERWKRSDRSGRMVPNIEAIIP